MPFLDIGSLELLLVAVLALIVVGPRELPSLMRTVMGMVRAVQNTMNDVKRGVDDLAREVEAEVDPFRDLKKAEGLRPGMSPEQITDHIMKNRGLGLDPGAQETPGQETAQTPSSDVKEPADGQDTDR